MSYKILDHATDLIVEVRAPTLETAFGAAGRAVVDATIDAASVSETGQRTITAHGKDLDYLLFSWLEEVAYLLITTGFAISRFDIRITKNSEYTIGATCFGEDLNIKKHRFKLEIKAPTFHEMEIRDSDGIYMKFLLDL